MRDERIIRFAFMHFLYKQNHEQSRLSKQIKQLGRNTRPVLDFLRGLDFY